MCGGFPIIGVTNCVPSDPRTSDASSIGVEWSGNVTAAGSTRRGYVLRGMMTSKSSERLKAEGHPESEGCLEFPEWFQTTGKTQRPSALPGA